MPCSSFRQGMITVIRRSLYIRRFHRITCRGVYHEAMKWLWLALASVACVSESAAQGFGTDLASYKTVYVLPMSSGLDQFLAIKLTAGSVMQVVTDPQKAELVFTDRIGAAFEDQLDELYKEKPKPDATDAWGSSRPIASPITRNRGTVFLVDRKTRDVVWTAYIKPGGSSADDMNHLASEIANKLAKDRKPAAK